MNAGRVDGERQILPQRALGLEHPSVALAWLHRQLQPRHRRDARRPWPGGVHHPAASDPLAACQPHRLHPVASLLDPDHLIGDELDPALARLAPPPLEHRATVEIALVAGAEGAENDIVQPVEGKCLGNLFRREDHRPRTIFRLHRHCFS